MRNPERPRLCRNNLQNFAEAPVPEGEPSAGIYRQNRWKRMSPTFRQRKQIHGWARCALTWLFGVVSITGLAATAGGAEGTPAPAGAEAIFGQFQQGEVREASVAVRTALKSAPDDPMLITLSGALKLETGDTPGALALLQEAVSHTPDDSLLLYGLGLAQLARGDRSAALHSFDDSERHGGDHDCLRIARRYTRWLGGDKVSSAPSDGHTAADSALMGLTAMRTGDARGAVKALEAAQTALTGDPILQPTGLLMSFDAAHPLEVSAAPAPAETAVTSTVKENAVSGNLLLSPEDLPASVAYVAYELDGDALGLIGSRPYTYAWNTRKAANGRHTITVVLYDRNVQEISRVNRTLRVFNPVAHPALPTEGQARLRTALWQALVLKPDRCACDYALGAMSVATGDRKAARLWFLRAAAIRPDYRDVRTQVIACGGMGEGNPAVYSGPSDEKIVALTFDDGPKPGVTEPLLATLTNAHVTATFFVIGRHVTEFPDLTRQITADGMEIANHSYTHRSLTALSPEEATREMLETQAAVLRVTGQMPRFVRPPGGNWNGRVAESARRWGLTPCMWTVDVFDAEIIGAQRVAEAVLKQVKPGSIILMHNGKVSTLQALPTILSQLKARGYRFVTVEDLAHRLKAGKGGAFSHPGPLPSRPE